MNFWTGLLEWDVQALLSINALHNPWMDRFAWLLSETMVWSPAVLVLLYVLIKNKKVETIWIVLAVALLFVFTDQVAGSVIKPLVGRLRPTRNPELLSYLDVVNAYLGGTYGFPSNHAANAFAFAGFSALLFKNKVYSLSIFFWAAMVAFSRIYLGVHYPLDVIVGALFGFLSAWMFYALYVWCMRRFFSWNLGTLYRPTGYTPSLYAIKDIQLLLLVLLTILISLVISSYYITW
jgi:undecaprenyl-diphosphatase